MARGTVNEENDLLLKLLFVRRAVKQVYEEGTEGRKGFRPG